MTKKLQASQSNRVWEKFHDHPYYKLCNSVFEVFQESCPTMVMTPEQLFTDAASTLEVILQPNDMSEEICKRLWTTTLNSYKERDGAAYGQAETKCEVAMLFYSLMYAFQAINDAEYRCTFSNILHEAIWKFYGADSKPNGCMVIERKLRPVVNPHTKDMLAWMEDYFNSTNMLIKEIKTVIKPAKANPKKSPTSKEKEPVIHTLNYLCMEENLRIKRINFVRRKWEEWNWLEENTNVDDFVNFFSGKPRDCQLKWKANNAILSSLLSEMLNREDLFGHTTGCSPRSIVINQFKKKYDRHHERVDQLNRIRIDWSIRLLDYKVSLELNQLPYHQGDDISDSALQEVFAGNMHITKDLNKHND